jgi:hypothetical protein
MDNDELYRLWSIELAAFKEYMAESSGDPVRPLDLKNRRISPKRIREAYERWKLATEVLLVAGGNSETIREMLAERRERPRSKD